MENQKDNTWDNVFAYMLKVIPNKLVVRSQLDIYVFIEFDTFPPLLCVHISYTPVWFYTNLRLLYSKDKNTSYFLQLLIC
jgi:hypothetical protein